MNFTPYLSAIKYGVLAAIAAAVWFASAHITSQSYELKEVRQALTAAQGTIKEQGKYDDAIQKQHEALQGIDARLDAMSRELRKRPATLPAASLAQCKGTTGAELSGPNAEFLAGEAARADRLRAALEACYAVTP